MKTRLKKIEMKCKTDFAPLLIYGSIIGFFVIAYLIIAPDPAEVHLRNPKVQPY